LAGDLPDQAREYVAAILTSVTRLSEQIETVLDLSQGEAGTLPVARDAIAIFAMLTDVVQERAERLTEGRLSLDLRGSDAIGTVNGDARRLARAFGHLVDNAIAATPPGGRILVDCARRIDRKVQVVVSDNGRGMEPAQLARALEGLTVAPDGNGVERRGGLGLPLVRQLIAAHGGTVELSSEPGQGTTAVVLLP
jgi:signal transduction histidine kinase